MRNLVEIINEIEYFSNHIVEIGILALDKEKKGSGKATILEYAVYNEFGTRDIPARPFMRNAIESNKESIQKYIERASSEVINGKISGRQGLIQIGEFIRGLIIVSIQTATNWAEPLAKKTLKAKLKKGTLNNKTLLDEKFLIKSIRFQILSRSKKQVYVSNFKEVR